MLQTLTQWPSTHSVLFTIILFVFAALISIYSEDIKYFLHHWPRTKENARKGKEGFLKDYLSLLKRVHNDSYQLTLYLATRIIRMLLYGMIVALVIPLTIAGFQHVPLAPTTYLGMCVGWLGGMFQGLNKFLRELNHYDVTVANIEQALSQLQTSSPTTKDVGRAVS